MAGRDAGKLFLVVAEAEENFRLVANGKLRSLAQPKRKKIKHLVRVDYSAELRELLDRGELTDRLLKQKLELFTKKAE